MKVQEIMGALTINRGRLVLVICAQLFNVPLDAMRQRTRGRPYVAQVRQIAMYLARSAFGMTDSDVARVFERDRSTVHHAWDVIGQERATSAELDARLSWLETHLKKAAGVV